MDKPQEEWIKVENTHEAIISADQFQIVQNLLKADGRVSTVTEENSLFTGILFCGDCGEQMIRRINRYKDTHKVYYICSTTNIHIYTPIIMQHFIIPYMLFFSSCPKFTKTHKYIEIR